MFSTAVASKESSIFWLLLSVAKTIISNAFVNKCMCSLNVSGADFCPAGGTVKVQLIQLIPPGTFWCLMPLNINFYFHKQNIMLIENTWK